MNISVPLRRRLALAVFAALVAAGLFWGFRPQVIEVDVGAVQRGPLRVTIAQEGRTRVRERYVVAAPVNGYARRVPLDVGQAVERGATLVELEPLRAEALDARRRAEAQARIAAADANVSAAGQRVSAAASNAALAQKELLRTRQLRPAGFVSATAEDRAASAAERSAAELRSAQFSAATARHELEAARASLQYAASASSAGLLAIASPVAGRVLKIPHKSEGAVSTGQPLIEIGDPGALEVEVDVLSADAVRLHAGTRVVFERWAAGFTKVSALGVEEQRVWVIVAFSSPPALWQRLGDGYRVEASFIVWEECDVLQIPASALFRDGAGWAVFAIEQGRAVRRRVEIGQRGGLAAQLVSGLPAGAQVIVHPDDRVRDGVRVVAR
ncbi:MAG: HlyD family efflux transporter periplasmic adaptor subunit [Polaromonas sp.]|nr:HlyD family efflux transporter periplasmic adaptor subunit [Polaromonas sp.]